MTAKDAIEALTLEQDQIGKGAEAAVTEDDVSHPHLDAEFLEKALLMVIEGPDPIVAHRTGGQRHQGYTNMLLRVFFWPPLI